MCERSNGAPLLTFVDSESPSDSQSFAMSKTCACFTPEFPTMLDLLATASPLTLHKPLPLHHSYHPSGDLPYPDVADSPSTHPATYRPATVSLSACFSASHHGCLKPLPLRTAADAFASDKYQHSVHGILHGSRTHLFRFAFLHQQ